MIKGSSLITGNYLNTYPIRNKKQNAINKPVESSIVTGQTLTEIPINFTGYIYIPKKGKPLIPEVLTKVYPDETKDKEIKDNCEMFYAKPHAEDRMKERNISVKDIEDTITCGKIYYDKKENNLTYVLDQPEKK